MTGMIFYPVEVMKFQVMVAGEQAEIMLEGSDQPFVRDCQDPETMPIGRILFRDSQARHDYVNDAGYLEMQRPLSLLPGILSLLHIDSPLFLRGDGMLASLSSTVGANKVD